MYVHLADKNLTGYWDLTKHMVNSGQRVKIKSVGSVMRRMKLLYLLIHCQMEVLSPNLGWHWPQPEDIQTVRARKLLQFFNIFI